MFEVRDLWRENGMVEPENWDEVRGKAIYAGGCHTTEFVAGHLCNIGFGPVMRAKFEHDPEEVKWAKKRATDIEFSRRYWWEANYKLIDEGH